MTSLKYFQTHGSKYIGSEKVRNETTRVLGEFIDVGREVIHRSGHRVGVKNFPNKTSNRHLNRSDSIGSPESVGSLLSPFKSSSSSPESPPINVKFESGDFKVVRKMVQCLTVHGKGGGKDTEGKDEVRDGGKGEDGGVKDR